MTQPKLALIPAAQGSKFYSVLPSSGVGDFTFSRSGSATRLNSKGLIETVGNGVSRLNYPLTNGKIVDCPHHLLEPQSTNLFLNSEPTSNEGAAGGITYESFNWFLGFSNCIKFGDNSSLRFRYGATVSATTQYTISAFVIMDDLSEPLVGVNNSSGDFGFVVGGATGGVANQNINYGNNIYRVSGTLTSGTNVTNNGIIKFTGQSSKGFRVVGLQIEELSYATSYIPTVGSSVTRSAEVANGSGNASTFNDSEGVLMAEISALANDGTSRFLGISDGGTTNRVNIMFNTDNTLDAFVGGVVTFDSVVNILDFNKVAIKYKSGDYAFWVNGVEVEVSTSTNGTHSGLNQLNFDMADGSNDFYGNIKQIQYYDSALTDSELQVLTS